MSKRLRNYAPMGKRSEKVKAESGAFAVVYRQVDQRSEGRCEARFPFGATMPGDGAAERLRQYTQRSGVARRRRLQARGAMISLTDSTKGGE